ncbi:Alkyl hydroperoxide reductase AhpD [Poriferisphaera corsica]|uniref:Alkyl hydroperoxide reductase AhpD n=1 Tax=Poriferisphaera corsica TaxID=2528020 RepID=A0A517YR92_9BACT|nr:carboxymuconolactone decarboxylase family protein [Poriferisphaera corsica]QDU32748.1 Alkyl hydroperoxide reductase AhpD [Poriferisphaera corsica]
MATIQSGGIEAIKEQLSEEAKDLKLNLSGIFAGGVLSESQTWGVILTSAYFIKDDALIDAFESDAEASSVSNEVISDAKAAASIMGMNTMYYRFKHLIGKESYMKKPARLRMQRMMTPATSKLDFELNSTAAAVLAGCEMCVKAHEASVLKEGLSEEHVHEAARLAAIIHGVSIALHVS